jgi:cell division protein FtsB
MSTQKESGACNLNNRAESRPCPNVAITGTQNKQHKRRFLARIQNIKLFTRLSLISKALQFIHIFTRFKNRFPDFVDLHHKILMHVAVKLVNILRNKYIAALTGFVILMLFIDHNDIFVQLDRRRQLNELLASKRFYEQQIAQTKKNLSDLENNSAALERYAREKYLLKKDNEDVFVVAPAKPAKKISPLTII